MHALLSLFIVQGIVASKMAQLQEWSEAAKKLATKYSMAFNEEGILKQVDISDDRIQFSDNGFVFETSSKEIMAKINNATTKSESS